MGGVRCQHIASVRSRNPRCTVCSPGLHVLGTSWHRLNVSRPFLLFLTKVVVAVVGHFCLSQEEELSVLGRGVLFYSRLGLEFEGGEVGEDGSMKCLRLVFRQVRSRCSCFTPSTVAAT